MIDRITWHPDKHQATSQTHLTRSEHFDTELVKEFGDKQNRTRVYRVLDADHIRGSQHDCFVTRTTYNAWGEHHCDEWLNLADGPFVREDVALEIAENHQRRMDEWRESQKPPSKAELDHKVRPGVVIS